MKKRSFFFVAMLISLVTSAQFMQVEIGPDFLRAEQEGVVYRNRYNHVPDFKTRDRVHEVYWNAGVRSRIFLALNWGTSSFEKFSWGPETGLTINKSSATLSGTSVSAPEKQYKANFQLPLLLSLRVGSSSAAYKKKCGLKISSGIVLMRSGIADESGFFVLPLIEAGLAVRCVTFGMSFYPVPLKSVTVIEGKQYPRLSTQLLSLTLTAGIDVYNRRYRATPDIK